MWKYLITWIVMLAVSLEMLPFASSLLANTSMNLAPT